MARGDRRVLIFVLPVSLLSAVALFVGALNHRLAGFARTGPGWPAHLTAEVLLWVGLALAVLVFAVTFVVFRREVRAVKRVVRQRRRRQQLLDALRRYEQDDQRRTNN